MAGGMTMMRPDPGALSPSDRAQLETAGIAVEEVVRQWKLLLAPPPPPRLVRPCTPGDGVRRIEAGNAAAYAEAGATFLAGARPSKFVPASGAATRMFQDLLSWRSTHGSFSLEALIAAERRDPTAASVLRTLRHIRQFAFFPRLHQALLAGGAIPERILGGGDATPVVAALLDAFGLDLAATPKALLPFHAGPDGSRTAFVEHLHEALAVAVGADGTARAHFTVSSDHHDRFVAARTAALAAFASQGGRLAASFSTQNASTDTIAVRADGSLARLADGRLLLRPAGHGALLGNLLACDGDLLLVRNIDNVEPASCRDERVFWTRVLAGVLAEIQAGLSSLAAALDGGTTDPATAVSRLVELIGLDLSPLLVGRDAAGIRAQVLERLARPIRVCGMVPNTGEPGGGPFWVAGADGLVAPQIIETAQVARTMDQQAVFAAATHFNPVDMILSPAGARGRRVNAVDLVDQSAVIVTRKSVGGEPLRVLERPGLWNGSMAGWNTVFVELPSTVFNPVKTINDLLRPAHLRTEA